MFEKLRLDRQPEENDEGTEAGGERPQREPIRNIDTRTWENPCVDDWDEPGGGCQPNADDDEGNFGASSGQLPIRLDVHPARSILRDESSPITVVSKESAQIDPLMLAGSVETRAHSDRIMTRPSPTMPRKLTIRTYRPADRPFLISCLEGEQDHMIGLDPFHDLHRKKSYGEAWARWHLSKVRKHRGRIFIAEASGTPVGFASCLIRTQDNLENLEYRPLKWGGLTGVFVVPDARGSGVGRSLIRSVELYLAGKGRNRVSLTVFAPNERAHHLYRSLGFQDGYIRMVKKVRRSA